MTADRPRCLKPVFMGCLLAAALGLSAAPGWADSADVRFLDGLRQRRLYELADAWCRQQLSRSELDDARRVELVIEWSRTLAEQARTLPPDQRAATWQRAVAITENFAREHGDSPRLVLVQVQNGLVRLAHGELLRQEAELAGAGEARFAAARDELRAAIAQLGDAASRIDQATRGGAAAGDGLDAEQWLALARNTRYQLARAYRNQAACYPPGSADRVNASEQARELLAPLTTLVGEERLTWDARIAEIECLRLVEDHAAAAARIAQALAAAPPPQAQLQLRAEMIRLALARDDLAAALEHLAAGRDVAGHTSAEFDLATIEALVAAWRAASQAGRADEARRHQDQAAQIIRAIDAEHGPYWARRAETIFAGGITGGAATADLDLLARAAESLYRTGQVDEALATFDRLYQQALDSGRRDEAFDAAYRAAAIEHQRDPPSAVPRLRRLATQLPADPRAADAHRAAVQLLSQAARGGDADALSQYQAALDEHLNHWPGTATAEQARLWLAHLYRYQRDWPAAIELLRQAVPGSPSFAEALQLLAASYRDQIAAQRAAGARIDADVRRAVDHFTQMVIGPRRQWPERWTPVERQAALEAARLLLQYTPTPAAARDAETLLTAALRAADGGDDTWQAEAGAWLVAAQAAQHNGPAAAQTLGNLATPPVDTALDVANLLGQIEPAGDADRANLAALQLALVGRLWPQRDALPPPDQRRLALLRAASLAQAGKAAEARDDLAGLAAQWPRDGDVQEAYAVALSAGDTPDQRQQALAQWRVVERHSQPASPRWFRAKYALAETHYQLGDHQQAARIIELTQVLHPDLGGPELQRKFRTLRAACQR